MSDSKKVFQLRRDKQIGDAYNLAIQLYNQEPYDEWIQKAYAWVLIDIVKIELNNDINKASVFFNQLQSINFVSDDDILVKQIDYLRPKFDTNYQEIQRANSSSKNGSHLEALLIFEELQKQGKLSVNHHEAYGWAIYRYIKANENNLSTADVKKFLFLYLGLKNHRPELLHSVILQFSVAYSSRHHDFNLYKFFELWNPIFLREEDKEKQHKDNKIYPSLVEKLIKEFINKNYLLNIDYLQDSIGNRELVIETIREVYFWKLYNLNKDNRVQELWQLFDFYASNFSSYKASHWHSEILKIADRYMKEDNAWRFFMFFQQWGVDNLQYEDWQEEINGEFKNKPIALKALKNIFNFSKLPSSQNNSFDWVLPLYEIALKKFDNDIWILREYATILHLTGDNQKAILLYKNIVLELNDQAYVWSEFSKLLVNSNMDIAISMLCKAISIQKNEDFLGDIHLELSKLLIQKEQLFEAKTELLVYEKHRIEKGWKTSKEFDSLLSQVSIVEEKNNDNLIFYKDNLDLADDYIYSDIPWIDLLLYDKWKTKEKKERIVFTNLNDIEFAMNVFKFKILKNAEIDDVYQFKIYYDKENQRYIPLKVQKSLCIKNDLIQEAPMDIAIVDHVNTKKELFHYVISRSLHGIIRFSQTNIRPKIGAFIKIKYFETYNKKRNEYKTNILNIELTNEIKVSLLKTTSGQLSLKYKYDENGTPDFGFVNDYYVSKNLLKKHHIQEDCAVEAKVLFNGDKWSVYELEILE